MRKIPTHSVPKARRALKPADFSPNSPVSLGVIVTLRATNRKERSVRILGDCKEFACVADGRSRRIWPPAFRSICSILEWHAVATSVDVNAKQWRIVERWQEYEAEVRSNLLRAIGIGVFYLIELLNHYGLQFGALELPAVEEIDRPFHIAVTALAAIWAMLTLGIHLCLRQRIFPWYLKFVSTGVDLVLLTSILIVADGPSSPLVVGYFLVVTLATLRLNLPLVWFATLGSMAGYLALCGNARWFTERDVGVPRYYQLIFLVAMALAGIVLGQLIRRLPQIASDYARRVEMLSDD